MKTNNNPSRKGMPRIMDIDRKIAAGRYPDTPSLAKEYEVSESTISRDIDFMKTRMGAPIEYDPRKRGYYYTDKAFRLAMSFNTPEEALALGMAKNLLAMFHDTPAYDTMRNLLEGIIAPARERLRPGEGRGGGRKYGGRGQWGTGQRAPMLRRPGEEGRAKSDANNGGWLENRVAVAPPPGAVVDGALWDTLIAALLENRIIRFEYRGEKDQDFRARRARPYQLLFDSGGWYLYAYAEDRKDTRVFALTRMRNADLCERTFILPDDYDYNSRFPESLFRRLRQQDEAALQSPVLGRFGPVG